MNSTALDNVKINLSILKYDHLEKESLIEAEREGLKILLIEKERASKVDRKRKKMKIYMPKRKGNSNDLRPSDIECLR